MLSSLKELFGLSAGILSFVAFLTYYKSILNGRTVPSRATWLILTIVGVLIASSYYSLGAQNTMWVAICYIVGPFITFLLSIKYGEGGWRYFDKICLLLSILSIILWFFSGSPLVALLINIFIDWLGILPTIKKVFLNHNSEDIITWTIVCIASICNLIAITEWDFSIYVYPVYMFTFNTLIMLLILFPKLKIGFKR